MKPSHRLALVPALLLAMASTSHRSHGATIVYSNDVLGDIEPCGCRSNPQGGMIRKSELLEQLRAHDPSILQLDAGDLLFDTDKIPATRAKSSELKARYLLKSMDLVHHDAVVPGEKDFALGVATFEKLRRGAHVRFLGANATVRGKRFLEPHAVYRFGKLRVGVFGLLGEQVRWPGEIKVSPAIAEARRQLAALKGQADLIVALTHEGYEADLALAKAVPGIDLIIGGHTQTFLQTPVKVGRTVICQSSFRNQFVGVIPLGSFIEKPFEAKGHRLAGLEASLDPASQTTPMQALVAEYKATALEVHAKEEAASCSMDPEKESAQLQGTARCSECHAKQADFWRKTAHAAKNAQCESCHRAGGEHPFSGAYRKAVDDKTCLKCHSPQGSPKWYKIQKLRATVTCPAGDLSDEIH